MPEITPPPVVDFEENNRLVSAAEYVKTYVNETSDAGEEVSLNGYVNWLDKKLKDAIIAATKRIEELRK